MDGSAPMLPASPRPVATYRRRDAIVLSPLDRAFLIGESLGSPCHVAFLSLLTPPDCAAQDFGIRLAERLRAEGAPVGPFNRRLDRAHGGTWVADGAIDMNHHVTRLGVAPPGTLNEVLELVAELHAAPLDRARPLWRIYVIDGLADGRIATYCKLHHAVADGVAGTRLLLRSMSRDATTPMPPPWAIPTTEENAARVRRGLPRMLGGMVEAIKAAPTAMAGAMRTWRELHEGCPHTVSGMQAPASILNQPVGMARTLAAQSYSLSRIQSLCRVFGGSTNVVVLALFSSALRRFLLQDCAALPRASLIAMVPMSTRVDQGAAGNCVAPLLVNLCTDRADPLERLHALRGSTTRSMDRVLGWTPAQIYEYALLIGAPGVFNLLLRPAGGALPFNLVISKLTGPREAAFWQGCRLDALYPLSIVTHAQALNLTYAIRHDTVDVGLVACARSLPGVGRVLAYVDDAIEELEGAAGRLAAQARRNTGAAASPRDEPPGPDDAVGRCCR